jgi:arsenate reductase-like glutaredoxin family protein
MPDHKPRPGVSRADRITNEGLARLENHLARGMQINPQVLAQWIRRYGEPARALIRQYGQYSKELDEVVEDFTSSSV